MADAAPPRFRDLVPREHGAWVQVLLPSLTALVIGTANLTAWSMVLAILALFVVHEPAAITLGFRGGRKLREFGGRARVALVVLGLIAVGSAAIAWWHGPAFWGWTLIAPVILGAVVGMLVLSNRERSTWGECLIAVALASTGLPVAVAAGLEAHAAIAMTCGWGVAFVLSTLSVRSVLGRFPRAEAAGLCTIGTLSALGVGTIGGMTWAVGMVPLLAAAAWTSLRPPARRRMRVLGLTFAALHGVALLALVVFPPR